MILSLSSRILRTVDPKCLGKVAWNFGFKGARSVMLFKKRLKQGIHFPPFLYICILNSCNLRCQGCWVDVEAPRNDRPRRPQPHRQRRARAREQLLRHPRRRAVHAPGAARLSRRSIRTATSRSSPTASSSRKKSRAPLRQLGNATPLVSIEGTSTVSDERRGSKDVLNRTLRGLDATASSRSSSPASPPASARPTSTTSSPRSGCDKLIDLRRPLHLVSHLPPGRPEDQRGTRPRPRTRSPRAPIRRRPCAAKRPSPSSTPTTTRRPGALPDGHRHQPPHQPRRRTSSPAPSSSSPPRTSTTPAASTRP